VEAKELEAWGCRLERSVQTLRLIEDVSLQALRSAAVSQDLREAINGRMTGVVVELTELLTEITDRGEHIAEREAAESRQEQPREPTYAESCRNL